MSDMKEITVQGVTVNVSTPYAEGHKITEAEAKSLNQTRAENIANNRRKQIKEMVEAAGGDTESVQADAQKLISEYDAEYVFTLASVSGGRQPVDPLTKECRKIARAAITGKIKEAGMTQKEYLEKNGEDAINQLVAQYESNEAIVKAAKKALAEREKNAGIADAISV